MKALARFSSILSRGLNWIAGFTLIGMMILVCANIVTRLFGKPILGTFELVQVLMIALIGFSLGYGSLTNCHTSVNLLLRRFSSRTQAIFEIGNNLVSIAIFIVIGWRCILLGNVLWRKEELSQTLWIPQFPLLYAVAINCFLAAIVLLFVHIAKNVSEVREK